MDIENKILSIIDSVRSNKKYTKDHPYIKNLLKSFDEKTRKKILKKGEIKIEMKDKSSGEIIFTSVIKLEKV